MTSLIIHALGTVYIYIYRQFCVAQHANSNTQQPKLRESVNHSLLAFCRRWSPCPWLDLGAMVRSRCCLLLAVGSDISLLYRYLWVGGPRSRPTPSGAATERYPHRCAIRGGVQPAPAPVRLGSWSHFLGPTARVPSIPGVGHRLSLIRLYKYMRLPIYIILYVTHTSYI